jgi:hypothetical protein
MPIAPHRLGPWVRGCNYSSPAEDLQPDEIFEMRNMVVGSGGQVFQRPGFDPYITAQVNGGTTLTACGKHKFTAASSSVFCVAGDEFREDVSGTWTDRTGGLTITAGDTNYWSFADANGTMVGWNGVSGDALVKWPAAGGNIAAITVSSRFTWATFCEWWDGRLWAGNNSNSTDQTHYSSNTSLTTWAANDWFAIGENMTGLKAFGSQGLTLHSENGIHLLTPTQNASIPYRRRSKSAKGTVSNRSIVTVAAPGVPQMQLFVREDGIYRFTGGEAEKISWKLDGDRFWNDVNTDNIKNSFAVANTTRNEVWFFLPVNATKNNKIVVFNYLFNTWYGPHAEASSLYGTWNCGATIDNVAHAGGYNDSGRLYKMDDTSELDDDDGSATAAVDAAFTTGAPPPLGSDVTNRYHFARTSFDIKGDYDVNITHFAPGIAAETSSFEQGGGYPAIETAFRIATSQIAGEDLMASHDSDLNGYDPTIQLTYANGSSGEEFSVRRVAVMYDPLKRIRKSKAGVY